MVCVHTCAYCGFEHTYLIIKCVCIIFCVLFHSVTNCYITVPLFCLNEECTMRKVVSFSIILFFQSDSSLNKTIKDDLVLNK